MGFEDINGGMDGSKELVHAKKWYVYNSDKQALVNVGYLVEVADMEVKKVIREVVQVREVDMIPEVREQLGCYHWCYIYLIFLKRMGQTIERRGWAWRQ